MNKDPKDKIYCESIKKFRFRPRNDLFNPLSQS